MNNIILSDLNLERYAKAEVNPEFYTTLKIVSIPILGPEEICKEILDNSRIHPFRKHFRCAQIRARKTLLVKWKYEREQKLINMHGLSIINKL